MKESNFAYYTILLTTASIVVLMFASLSEDPLLDDKIEEDPYEISCQQPVGHSIKYRVSKSKRVRQLFVGGIWNFETVEGKLIASTFCHLVVDSAQEI